MLCRKGTVHVCKDSSRQGLCHCDVGCWHGFRLAGFTLETLHCWMLSSLIHPQHMLILVDVHR